MFFKNQKVIYHSKNVFYKAVVKDVHTDDPEEEYYTLDLGHKEVQTVPNKLLGLKDWVDKRNEIRNEDTWFEGYYYLTSTV